MSIQTTNLLFTYDQQTGKVQYNAFPRRAFTGPVIDLSTATNLETVSDRLGVTVSISAESQALLEKSIAEKQQREVDTLSEIYESVGLAEQAPKIFGDLTATDRALLNQHYAAKNDGATSAFINFLSPYMQNGETSLYAYRAENAVDVAIQYEYVYAYFNDDAVRSRIDAMNLPEDADKALLFQASKTYGDKIMKDFAENIARAAELPARQEARNTASFLAGSSENWEQMTRSFAESYEQLFLETVDEARRLIREGYDGDMVEKLKAYTANNSTVRFDVNGVSLTLTQLESANNVLKEATNQVLADSVGYSYEELGKRHASIYQTAKKGLSWLSSEDADKILAPLKNEVMPSALNRRLGLDVARLAVAQGLNGVRINVGEEIKNNPVLQGYKKLYEQGFNSYRPTAGY